ncbi:LysR family transcriptional regulator [Shewanella baltica]|jgi:DNA-binding transcriptional LysR family regulator|uniref:Transcriptional regulator, LysR family n=1 Tax=Shewanella baltica (strain OS155 / ATCC BAA-1091) TaxID=325240 RepID=A3CZ79_SHEB5|nr:LysR family transcriptional regulator [Shewanella baltica]ABN59792.1 transcriptional regulator, LysR family [Shewanella baltica OS155]AEH12158.1 transcriptional regulator, LysR family [Shewanella baltica OS117]MCS6114393.1 LysR family transcriptional regulator [Shewanella baltica]MCS6209329.1 LysR family transcriptional regulator [Shewanella baltica]MCS6236553.1 LysR family transcriptional regulator [Shewanella baltica]
MLKIELLESFIAVAECGNMSKAADKVCRTQSTLSLQIKKLEEVVGQSLLLRDNKGTTLTESGSTLLNYAYKMMQLNSQAIHDLKDCQNREIIRLGVPTDYIKFYLNSCLLEFIREFTCIELVIDTDVSGNLFKRLQQGEFDLIVATHWQAPVNGELLFSRRFHWAAAKNGQAHKRSTVPMALYPENCPIRAQVFANHQLSMRPINVLLSTPSPQALCMAVENDLAIAPIAEFRTNEHMQILDPHEHGLPPLPIFNESLYLNPETQTEATMQLITLIKANVEHLSDTID